MGLNFDVSYSGISAAQKAIQVVQTNMANATTPGYARQELGMSVNQGLAGAGVNAEIGNGVISDQVNRIVDEFLIGQARGQQSEVGYHGSLRSSLASIENIFSETSEGSISKLLSGFFNSWEELSKYPEENSYRYALVTQSQNLASKLNTVDAKLVDIKKTADDNIKMEIGKVNSLSKKIADINEKINQSAMERPNSLLDERDRYINELSSYVDIQVSTNIQNSRIVDIKVGGVSLVSGPRSIEVGTMVDSTTNELTLTAGNSVLNVKSGSLQANFEIRNEYVPRYQEELNQFSSVLLNKVNEIHSSGYGLDNSTGINFFVGAGSSSIKVNPLFSINPERIATSSKMDATGNADISREIVALKDKNIMANGSSNPIAHYNGFAIQMATELNIVRDNEKVHENILSRVEEQKQSVQGVNIDEELSNLLRFEQYYAANSKVMSTIDKVYDLLFQMF